MKIWLTIILFWGGLALLAVPTSSQETDGMGEKNALEIESFFSMAAKADNYLKEGDYNRAIAHYRQFLEQYPRSRYSTLSFLQVAGIYQDYLNDYVQAKEMYEKVLALSGEDRLVQLSQKIARRWRERIKLAIIEQALNRYYAHEVKYPASLNTLFLKGYLNEDCLRSPERNSYFYQLRNSSLFPELKGQEYTLYSSNLGQGESSLSLLVEEKRAFSYQFSLQGLMGGPQGKKAVINYKPEAYSGKQKTEMLTEGDEIGKAQVLEITDEGVILSGEETFLILTMGR